MFTEFSEQDVHLKHRLEWVLRTSAAAVFSFTQDRRSCLKPCWMLITAFFLFFFSHHWANSPGCGSKLGVKQTPRWKGWEMFRLVRWKGAEGLELNYRGSERFWTSACRALYCNRAHWDRVANNVICSALCCRDADSSLNQSWVWGRQKMFLLKHPGRNKRRKKRDNSWPAEIIQSY